MNEKLLKIGAAYIRVSDERQDEYSPDSQLKKIRDHAAKDGYFIPDEYVFYDDGISGKNVKKRTDFNRMIAIAKEKNSPFDVIFVWKFSRFARNQEESMVYKNLLRKKGITVISVSESIPEGHFGTLVERIIEWMDEFYLINLGEEVKRGMTEKASRGEPTCAPPYGYIMKDGMYCPDNESGAADVVKEIFQRYNNGEGTRTIAIDLGNRGIRTKYNGIPENRWIEYILRNPCYIGKIRWSLNGARAVSKRKYDNENIMIVEGKHEPLISEELWTSVQKKLDESKKLYAKWSRKEEPTKFMLKGLVRCSSCGATLTRGTMSGKNISLQCHNYAHGTCHVSHSISLPKLEQTFIKALNDCIGKKEFKFSPPKNNIQIENEANIEKYIILEEKKLERAKEAYLAGIDTIEQYAINKKNIQNKIEELKKLKKEETKPKTTDEKDFAQKVSDVAEFIQRSDVDETAKNKALRTIIEKIVYEKPQNNIDIYFHSI